MHTTDIEWEMDIFDDNLGELESYHQLANALRSEES